MSRDDDIVMVISNAPDLLLAKRIAHVLVEDGLAACVNLGAPVLSIYSWKGEIEGADEIPMWIKTTAGRQQALIDALSRLHPYEVPEAAAQHTWTGCANRRAANRRNSARASPGM